MIGKIKAIEGDATFKIGSESWPQHMDGVVVTLESGHQYGVGISSYSQCCEAWDFISSEDDYDEFIGADLIKIQVVDGDLKKYDLEPNKYGDTSYMFVDFVTSKGVFQTVCYNSHNGYYSHTAGVYLLHPNPETMEEEYL